jgi:hypothetical protein
VLIEHRAQQRVASLVCSLSRHWKWGVGAAFGVWIMFDSEIARRLVLQMTRQRWVQVRCR